MFKNTNGLSLLEMLLAIFMFALIAAAVALVFNRSLFVYRYSTEKNAAAQEAHLAAEWLLRDIQSAAAVVRARRNVIDLVTREPMQYIRYQVDNTDPANPTLTRQMDCAGPQHLVAENVNQFSLKYFDIANNEFDPGAPPNELSADQLSQLRTAEIDLTTARSTGQFHFNTQLNTAAMVSPEPYYFWAKAYGGADNDQLFSLRQIHNGYILAGDSASFGNNILAIKTDLSGNLDWANTYGAGSEGLRSVQEAIDGYIVLGGTTGSYAAGGGGTDFFLVKANPDDGSVDPADPDSWARTYGGAGAEAEELQAMQTVAGIYILAGNTRCFGAGTQAGMVIRTEPDGLIGATPQSWARTYGYNPASICNINSFLSIPDGYILVGSLDNAGLVIRTNVDGNVGPAFGVTWVHTYSNVAEFFSILPFNDGVNDGFVLGGRTAGGLNVLAMIDIAGNPVWGKTYNVVANVSRIHSILPVTNPDGLILGFGNGNDFLLMRTDANGDVGPGFANTWSRTYGGPGTDVFTALRETHDGQQHGYILGGHSDSFGVGQDDFLFIKTDTSGDLNFCAIDQTPAPPVTSNDFAVNAPTVLTADGNFAVNDLTSDVNFVVNSPTPAVTEQFPTTTHICPACSYP